MRKKNSKSKAQKTLNGIIGTASFILLLVGLGGIQRMDNMFIHFILSLIGLGGLYYTAYSAGWLYSEFYEDIEDEE